MILVSKDVFECPDFIFWTDIFIFKVFYAFAQYAIGNYLVKFAITKFNQKLDVGMIFYDKYKRC
jgi:hypothetical protein